MNNALTVLSQTLKCAVEWGVIDAMPAKIQLLKLQKTVPSFYDFDEYEWLIGAARKIDPRLYLLVLLGGDAGLRRGEVIALEQSDCDLRRGHLTVRASEWQGNVTETKGMETRVVPMTARLKTALIANQHLIGDRVLYSPTMEKVTAKVVQKWMAAIAIQKLAGHKNLQTTLRYMHLAAGETHRAIRLLDAGHDTGPAVLEEVAEDRVASSTATETAPERSQAVGDILETEAKLLPFPKSLK